MLLPRLIDFRLESIKADVGDLCAKQGVFEIQAV